MYSFRVWSATCCYMNIVISSIIRMSWMLEDTRPPRMQLSHIDHTKLTYKSIHIPEASIGADPRVNFFHAVSLKLFIPCPTVPLQRGETVEKATTQSTLPTNIGIVPVPRTWLKTFENVGTTGCFILSLCSKMDLLVASYKLIFKPSGSWEN